ncbi:MAG: SAM-dependent methyltransferase, partial [Cyclobacteriaceae bacterium]|nr:SAM-dependent methyltransferase [Cyclobacteriaceae bacterium]
MLKHSWARAWHYLTYWLDAVNSHSLHAPFIYSLFTEVIQPQYTLKLESLEHFLKELYLETDIILVNDLGAGADQDQKPAKRVIGRIAKNSHNPKVAQLLYRLVQHFNCRKVLELGTNLGLTTMNLAKAAPQGTIATMEGCPNLAERAQKHFKKFGLKNIKPYVGA